MDFYSIMRPEIIELDMDAADKDDVLHKLADLFVKDGTILSTEAYLNDVYEREKEGVTGMGNFIAIPHGKSDSVVKTSVAFARLKKPIQWETLDGNPVKMIFLFAVPNKNRNMNHLRILSQLASILAHDETMALLTQAKTSDEVIDIFTLQNMKSK